MKTDFSINVNVSIGVTPEVVALVTSILTKQPATIPAASDQPEATVQEPAPAPAKRGRKAKTDAPANEPEPSAEAAPAAAAENPTDAPEPEPQPEPSAEVKELTEQDIREAMDRTRKRIEGEDYKNNTDSEGYVKYHKVLTANFKNIAALLGSDKPSTLPVEKRESFIKECDALVILEDGTIGTKAPF